MIRVTDPIILEEEARVNAQTIRDQQVHYTEEISKLHREYRQKLEEKDEALELRSRAIYHIAKERNRYRTGLADLHELLENAVIDPWQITEPVTLWFLVESETYRV